MGHGHEGTALAAGDEQGVAGGAAGGRAAEAAGAGACGERNGIIQGQGCAEAGQVAQSGGRWEHREKQAEVGQPGEELEQAGFAGAVIADKPEDGQVGEAGGEPGGQDKGGEELGNERRRGEGASEIHEVKQDGDERLKDLGRLRALTSEVALEAGGGPEPVIGQWLEAGGQRLEA